MHEGPLIARDSWLHSGWDSRYNVLELGKRTSPSVGWVFEIELEGPYSHVVLPSRQTRHCAAAFTQERRDSSRVVFLQCMFQRVKKDLNPGWDVPAGWGDGPN